MTFRTFVLAGGVIVAAVIVGGVGTQAQTQAFRTTWGDPDIQGIFTTDDELGVPFERPQQFAGRDVVSDKEFEERRAQARLQAEVDAGEVVAPPAALDMYDRCITRGLPHVIFPTIYNNTSQIVQGPGFVAIRYEMIHDARVIPLDGRPQLSPTIRQYFGDCAATGKATRSSSR
jgi:hypothetical protein